MVKYQCLPKHIYNTDHTGISTAQERGIFVAPQSQKRARSVTRWQRSNLCLLCCVCGWQCRVCATCLPSTQIGATSGKIRPSRCNLLAALNLRGLMANSLYFFLLHFMGIVKTESMNMIILVLDSHNNPICLLSYQFCKGN